MMEALLNLQAWLILADLIVMVSVILALYILVLIRDRDPTDWRVW